MGFETGTDRLVTLRQLLRGRVSVSHGPSLTAGQQLTITARRIALQGHFDIGGPTGAKISKDQAIREVLDPTSKIGAALNDVEHRALAFLHTEHEARTRRRARTVRQRRRLPQR